MVIPEAYVKNFDTLRRAAKAGDLALMECTDAKTGQPRYVICAVGRYATGVFVMTPFGILHDGNPFDYFFPPTAGCFWTRGVRSLGVPQAAAHSVRRARLRSAESMPAL